MMAQLNSYHCGASSQRWASRGGAPPRSVALEVEQGKKEERDQRRESEREKAFKKGGEGLADSDV